MSYDELSTAEPVARKDHRCEWCDETIPKGEKHWLRSYVFEGEFNSGRMHFECKAAMEKEPREQLADGWLPGDYPRGEKVQARYVSTKGKE